MIQPHRFITAFAAFTAALAAVAGGAAAAKAAAPSAPNSIWAYPDPRTGRLRYKTTERGDRMLDFSYAGYGGGGVELPFALVRFTLSPSGSGEDDTKAIQGALDALTTSAPDRTGLRGAVLLNPGVYHLSEPIVIHGSGIVLRGSGTGETGGGTILKMTGKPHVCIVLDGGKEKAASPAGSSPIAITDAYVPAGTNKFRVADAKGFRAGDRIRIVRPVTPAWVKFMGMDTLVRNGKPQTWVSGETTCERTVRAVVGNTLLLDIPLSDSYDAHFLNPPGATVEKIVDPAGISQVGVANLRIVAPPQPIPISEPHHQAITVSGNVTDGFLRSLILEDTVDSISFGPGTRRFTAVNVQVRHTVATPGAAKPMDFRIEGTQILIDRCGGIGDSNFYIMTGGRSTGPNVALNCTFQGNGHLQPHMRWSTGLLVDNCAVPGGGIDFMNRGIMGSGHGWTMGWGVAWNCTAKSFQMQNPPGAVNWVIGCRGTRVTGAEPGTKSPILSEADYDSFGSPVTPKSLYLEQLAERLGPAAVKAIGY